MLYKHSKRYQAILREAVRIAQAKDGINLIALTEEAGLGVTYATLKDFMSKGGSSVRVQYRTNAKSDDHDLPSRVGYFRDEHDAPIEKLGRRFLSYDVAEKLWSFLDVRGYIEFAISSDNIDKRDLSSVEEFAGSMQSFFNVHDGMQSQAHADGLKGTFACYKRSFRYDGFVVRSAFEVNFLNEEFFQVEDHQRSSGRCAPAVPIDREITMGFGIIKSRRFWVFGRENNKEQPRVMCFYQPIRELGRIKGFYGHVMEGAQDAGDDFLSIPILLLTRDFDEMIWSHNRANADMAYDFDGAMDIIPFMPDKVERFGMNLPYRIPEQILRFVVEGRRFNDR